MAAGISKRSLTIMKNNYSFLIQFLIHHCELTTCDCYSFEIFQMLMSIFTTYVLISPSNRLTPQQAFTILSCIDAYNDLLSFFPIFLSDAAQVGRVNITACYNTQQ